MNSYKAYIGTNLSIKGPWVKSITMHNAVNNQTPNYLSSRFFSRNETLTYNLRNTEGKLFLPQLRTIYCKRSSSYSGAVFWNSLPNEIKLSSTLDDSSMSGVWERLAHSAKTVLKAILRTQVVTETVFQSLLTEVERVLNGRALTANWDDPSDLQPLTPVHIYSCRGNPSAYLQASSRKQTSTGENGSKSNFLLTCSGRDGCGNTCQLCKSEENGVKPYLTWSQMP